MFIYLKVAFIYTLSFMLALLIFGVIFSVIEKKNSSAILNTFGMRGLLLTGVIGTVIHEFSHMICCVIFGHEITSFSLFRPVKSSYDGVMGYVNHRFNKKSYYQRFGNFFIGIAPIIFGTIFLILCMMLILPKEFNNVVSIFNKNMQYMENINHIGDSINIYITIVLSTLENLSPINRTDYWNYFLFLYIMYSVTTHMDLSREDLNNSRGGFFIFFLVVFIINLGCLILGLKYQVILLRFIISIFSFLTVGLLFAVITMIISKTLEIFLT